jgi:hypothetical protein
MEADDVMAASIYCFSPLLYSIRVKYSVFCSYYPVGLATAATTMAAEAAQPVTVPQQIMDLGEQQIDGRKPSLVSTDVVKAESNDPDSIFHVYFFLDFWLLKYSFFYPFTSISCYIMIFMYDMNRRGCCALFII